VPRFLSAKVETQLSNPSALKMPESYAETEARIERAPPFASHPNIAAVARELQIPATRLRARWNGRTFIGTGTCPSPTHGICRWIKNWRCTLQFGTSARFSQSILRRGHGFGGGGGPQFRSAHERHPEVLYTKQKKILSLYRLRGLFHNGLWLSMGPLPEAVLEPTRKMPKISAAPSACCPPPQCLCAPIKFSQFGSRVTA